MYFHIQHNRTKQILYGCWCDEYLQFKSDIKIVSYNDYKMYWLPMNIGVDHEKNKEANKFIKKLWKRK